MECIIGIGNSIVGKLTELSVEPVGRQIGYFFHYKKNVENLRTQVQNLKFAKETIDRSVAEARDNCGIIKGAVELWLNEADSIFSEAEKLVSIEEARANTSWSMIRSFSRLIKRYKLGKEAKNIAVAITAKLEQVEKFGKVYYRLPPSNSFKIKGYEEFQTRAGVILEVKEALRDGNVRMIGVWGMGGVGKTMLVKEVARQAKDENLFSRVVFTTISQTPDYKSIQQEVAASLGLELEENNVAFWASRLRDRLRSEKNILIIIDDVWSYLDLEELGLSFAGDQKACKILLTSRSQDVLCNEMGVDRSFSLLVLSEYESFDLFNQIVGNMPQSENFQMVKEQIVEKCAGLPLAISVVAKALKNKSISVWEDALQELRTSNPANIKGVEKEVFAVIRWSYDFLESEEAKSILLLCSLHKEDEDISIEELLMHGMGLRVFHGIKKLKDARNRVFHLVDILKSASLLLDASKDNCVRMHDVIRSVVLAIASKDKQMYFVANVEDISERLNDNELENSKAITLSYCPNVLLKRPFCTKLELFYIVKSKLAIQENYFEVAKELKVFCLQEVDLNPSSFASFRCLNNLKTLTISQSKVGNIESIGELKCLEMLDLSGSDVKMVPKQLGKLTRLLSLNLSYCQLLKVIEPGVVSSFQLLEELHMQGPSFTRWARLREASANSCSNACLTELKQLRHLTALYMDILDVDNLLPDGLFTDKLERYQIRITSQRKCYFSEFEDRWSRSLILDKVNDSLLEHGSLKLLIKRAESLHLRYINISKAFCDELGECGYLKVLELLSVHTPRYVFNTHGCTSAFQHLEELRLRDVEKLETICNGSDLSAATMAKLRVIFVKRCSSLKNLLPLSFSYRQLEKLKVSNCGAMEDIFINVKNDDEMIEFPLLSCVKLQRLPELKQFVAERRDNGLAIADATPCNDAPLFNHKVAFPALSELTLIQLDSITMIDNELQLGRSMSFNKLKKVKVSNCSRLKSLFTTSVGKAPHGLESVRLENCRQLREIIAKEEGPTEIVPKFVFPRLNSLYLFDLPELETLCSSLHYSEWPSLGELELVNCGKVKILASQLSSHRENTRSATLSANAPLFITDTVAFPKLKKIDLSRLDQLEMIWQGDHELVPGSFGELKDVSIEGCHALIKVFSLELLANLVSFIELKIEYCNKVEEVFETCCGTVTTPLTSLHLSSLPKLKHVWSYKDQCHLQSTRPSFITPKLKEVYVEGCPSLKSLLPACGAKDLLGLENIHMSYCEQMQEIIREEEKSADGIPKFKFPKFTSILLVDLPELKHFYPGLHTSEWPSLSDIYLRWCGGVQILASELSAFKKSMSQEAQPKTPWLLMEKVAFPKLKEIELYNLDRLEMIWQVDHELIPGELESLFIGNCKALIKVFEMQGPTSAETSCGKIISSMTFLFLSRLPKLKHVWSYKDQCNSQAGRPSFITPKLKKVIADDCPSLQSLFPASVAEDLLELESIEIRSCSQMQEIIAEEKDATEITPKFDFPKLTSMILIDLLELKRLYPGLHTSEWPSLRNLQLMNCVKVKILASQLQTFKMNMGREARDDTPLLMMETVRFPNLSEVIVDSFDRLEMIWESSTSQLSVVMLNNLLHLKGSLFPSSTSFELLTTLVISRCDVKSLFAPSTARSMPKLTGLVITECETMTEVIGDAPGEGEIAFNELRTLGLVCLPKLACFHTGNYTLVLPNLEQLAVLRCPEMRSFSCEAITPKLKKIFTRMSSTSDSDVFSFQNLYHNAYYVLDSFQRAGLRKGQHWDGNINSTLHKLYHSNKQDSCEGTAPAEDSGVDVTKKITEVPEAGEASTECHETQNAPKF